MSQKPRARWYLKLRGTNLYRMDRGGHATSELFEPPVQVHDGSGSQTRLSKWYPCEPVWYATKEAAFESRRKNCCGADWVIVRRWRKSPTKRLVICGDQSPTNPNDEDDPPVTCTEPKGHQGDHAGGTRCGTVTWPKRSNDRD